MKITVKLAYSQLKINRSRTLWTLLAITLSTALIMAVCSFVASGNAVLVRFLGGDYGVYGKSYMVLLLIPGAIFGILILAMSVTVVSNVFRISAQERVVQFGILKCTGATKKQITDTVIYESVLLCAAGIPAGIALGIVLALGGMGAANYFLDDLNALVHLMMEEIDLTVSFVFSWKAAALSGALCFISTLFSAWLPAHKAAAIPAMDCIRGAGDIKILRGQMRTAPLMDKLFGFEGTLAAKNIRRNRRSFRATMISLSVGVILFISLGGLGGQAEALEDYMSPAVDYAVTLDYVSAYRTDSNWETGKAEKIALHPIDSRLGDKVAQRLAEFEDLNVFGIGIDTFTYDAVLSKDQISKEMEEVLETGKKDQYELSAEIIALDQRSYLSLCKKTKLPPGSAFLLNHYKYNDFGQEVNLVPFSPGITSIGLRKADGSVIETPIEGLLTQEDIPKELFYPNAKQVRLIVPQARVRDYTWYCTPSDIDGFMEYSREVLSQFFPNKTNSSYREAGFHTRVFRSKDYLRVMNIAIALAAVFMYSFAALLMLIGLTNVISTLSTNVAMRSREFAVLKSAGMTPESLKRMLDFESVLCTAKALLYGIPIGIFVTYLISLPIRSMFPIPYKTPWLSILLCVAAVFFITWSVTRYAAHKLKNQNIIEAIRAESGR